MVNSHFEAIIKDLNDTGYDRGKNESMITMAWIAMDILNNKSFNKQRLGLVDEWNSVVKKWRKFLKTAANN